MFKPLEITEGSHFIGKLIQLHDIFKAAIACVDCDHGKRNLLQVAEVVTVWRHESVVRMLPEHPESSSAESGPKEFLVPHVHNMSLAPKTQAIGQTARPLNALAVVRLLLGNYHLRGDVAP